MQPSESPKRPLRVALSLAGMVFLVAYVIWRMAIGRIPVGPFLALCGGGLVLGLLIGLVIRHKRSRG